MLKESANQVLGKTISGMVYRQANDAKHTHLFLIFDDNTYCEFWSNGWEINCRKALDVGGIKEVRHYVRGKWDDGLEATI